MRRAIRVTAGALLLAGPTVLAFYSGGFFTEPRLIAGIVAWLLVLLLAVVGPAPIPRSLAGWLAVGGLLVLTAWSALSITWAPLRGPATGSVELLVLYLGALLVAIGALRPRPLMRAVEPALAGGATIVICYGLSGRLLPGIVHLAHSIHAGGRLEQPITYWNSEGALAAVGFVLCARLAGDRTRPVLMRSLAAAATAPLGAGVYLAYSRGAIAALVVGLVLLVAAAPVRSQFQAAIVAVVAGGVAAACSSALPGVASLSGGLGARERDGAIMLAIFVLVAVAAAFVTGRRSLAEERGAADARLPGARGLPAVAAAVLGIVVAGLLVGGLREKAGVGTHETASAGRLTSASSNRYAYWRAGARAFRHHPLAGLGAGGYRVFWLRERPVREVVQNAHSIELETAAELGVVGLAALLTMFAGVALAARRAFVRHPVAAAGPCAAALVWLLHASIDWDWQLPAVSLPAVILAGALIALAEEAADAVTEAPAVRSRTGDLPVPAESPTAGGAVLGT